jgi:RNA polymerase sigma factor (sigma-70 family)
LDAIALLGDTKFLSSLYGFAYKRTNNSYEAEDLCSDIALAVMASVRKNSDIGNPHAFVWAVARRVYADYSHKRRIAAERGVANGFCSDALAARTDCISDFIESDDDKMRLRRILREVGFLSKLYRDVCVMYYLEEMKVPCIAKRLGITQNTVKQRLYSARETIKKGVKKMDNKNLTLQPIDIAFIGTGNPVGNDPRVVAGRSFSKALIYLCKDTERSVKELSGLLGVPMPFVEEEVEIQVQGSNGYYGLLKKTDGGKYISNFIIIDYEDCTKVTAMYRKHMDIIVHNFNAFLKENEKRILALPFLNKQEDTRLVAWPLLYNIHWGFMESVERKVGEKYFSGVVPTTRDFFSFGIAIKPGQDFDIGFYGCDGIDGKDIGGYKEVFVSNIYGRRLQKHFACGHNISHDAQLLLTLKAVGGLPLTSLSENERETAAKAIEAGYLKKEKDVLHPRILVSEGTGMYWNVLGDFFDYISSLTEAAAEEVYGFIKKFVPKHLTGEYKLFVQQTSSGLLDGMVEKCIALGTLTPPENKPSAEGVLMVVNK